MVRGLRRGGAGRFLESRIRFLNTDSGPAARPALAAALHAALTRPELRALAAAGALNALHGHRRAALWAVEDAWGADGDVDGGQGSLRLGEPDSAAPAPLRAMDPAERLRADFAHTGLTSGAHPMALLRPALADHWTAAELQLGESGLSVRVSGAVICRQRPGTAKGVVFVSLEDETGIANIICHAPFFEANRLVVTQEPFLTFTGRLQNERGVIHVLAATVERLEAATAAPEGASHDFH
jgi:error-prone DNA polymerase